MKTEDLLEEIGNVSQDLIADHALPKGAASEHAGRKAKKEIIMKSNQKSEYIKNPFVRILPGIAAVAAVVVAAVVIVPKLNLRGTQPPTPATSLESQLEDESSSGQDLVNGMPDLIGMNVDEARRAYDNLDIVVISREYSDMEDGFIFDQDVVPGSPVKRGDTVNVKVSLGSKKVQLPDMKGWPYEQAKNELLRLGLFVDKRSAYDETVPEGSVISTDPVGGDVLVEPGSYVRVMVSLGETPDTVLVPNFVGMNFELAKMTADGMGLQLEKKEVEDTAPEGIILSQNIKTGEEVSENTVIELTVSKGSAEKDGTVRITFSIPAGIKGTYHLKLMKDGVATSVSTAFNPELAAGSTSITVEGEGETDLIAVLVNDDTGAEATIGTYHIDFEAKTSQMMSGSIEEAFRQLNGGNE